jgi:hypothetical protein
MRRFREVKGIQQMTEFSSAAAPLTLLDPPYVLITNGSSGFSAGLTERFLTMKWFNRTTQGFSPGNR